MASAAASHPAGHAPRGTDEELATAVAAACAALAAGTDVAAAERVLASNFSLRRSHSMPSHCHCPPLRDRDLHRAAPTLHPASATTHVPRNPISPPTPQLAFREAPDPYGVCDVLLARSTDPAAHFQALLTLEAACGRDWGGLSVERRAGLSAAALALAADGDVEATRPAAVRAAACRLAAACACRGWAEAAADVGSSESAIAAARAWADRLAVAAPTDVLEAVVAAEMRVDGGGGRVTASQSSRGGALGGCPRDLPTTSGRRGPDDASTRLFRSVTLPLFLRAGAQRGAEAAAQCIGPSSGRALGAAARLVSTVLAGADGCGSPIPSLAAALGPLGGLGALSWLGAVASADAGTPDAAAEASAAAAASALGLVGARWGRLCGAPDTSTPLDPALGGWASGPGGRAWALGVALALVGGAGATSGRPGGVVAAAAVLRASVEGAEAERAAVPGLDTAAALLGGPGLPEAVAKGLAALTDRLAPREAPALAAAAGEHGASLWAAPALLDVLEAWQSFASLLGAGERAESTAGAPLAWRALAAASYSTVLSCRAAAARLECDDSEDDGDGEGDMAGQEDVRVGALAALGRACVDEAAAVSAALSAAGSALVRSAAGEGAGGAEVGPADLEQLWMLLAQASRLVADAAEGETPVAPAGVGPAAAGSIAAALGALSAAAATVAGSVSPRALEGLAAAAGRVHATWGSVDFDSALVDVPAGPYCSAAARSDAGLALVRSCLRFHPGEAALHGALLRSLLPALIQTAGETRRVPAGMGEFLVECGVGGAATGAAGTLGSLLPGLAPHKAHRWLARALASAGDPPASALVDVAAASPPTTAVAAADPAAAAARAAAVARICGALRGAPPSAAAALWARVRLIPPPPPSRPADLLSLALAADVADALGPHFPREATAWASAQSGALTMATATVTDVAPCVAADPELAGRDGARLVRAAVFAAYDDDGSDAPTTDSNPAVVAPPPDARAAALAAVVWFFRPWQGPAESGRGGCSPWLRPDLLSTRTALAEDVAGALAGGAELLAETDDVRCPPPERRRAFALLAPLATELARGGGPGAAGRPGGLEALCFLARGGGGAWEDLLSLAEDMASRRAAEGEDAADAPATASAESDAVLACLEGAHRAGAFVEANGYAEAGARWPLAAELARRWAVDAAPTVDERPRARQDRFRANVWKPLMAEAAVTRRSAAR